MKILHKFALLFVILSLIFVMAACETVTDATYDNFINDSANIALPTEATLVNTDTDATSEPTQMPANEATQAPTTEATEAPTTEATEAPTAPVHIHSFRSATCTEPKTCECGATEGSAKGHDWKEATCTDPETCKDCGTKEGSATGHSYSNGKCSFCGQADPSNSGGGMVWIPTKGGKKYHSHSGCSNMNGPEYVTKSEAISRGFDACKKCY